MVAAPFDYETTLAACAQGDQESFQALYRHESPRMLALCIKMLSDRADALELVRDVFVLIWKNAEKYDPEMGTARAWLYSIMRYRVLNRLRQSGRSTPSETEWIDTLPDNAAATDQPDSDTLLRRLSQLDDTQRRPILMAFYNGYTYDQIATRLTMPAHQVKAQVRAGLRAISESVQA